MDEFVRIQICMCLVVEWLDRYGMFNMDMATMKINGLMAVCRYDEKPYYGPYIGKESGCPDVN